MFTNHNEKLHILEAMIMSLKASPCTASMVLLPIVNVFPYYILLNDSVGLLKLDFKIFSSPFPCFLFMCLFISAGNLFKFCCRASSEYE